MRNLLRDVATLGPFFATEVHIAGATLSPPWRRMSELVAGTSTMAMRIHDVRAALATSAGRRPEAVEPRVAASVAQLGLAARLLSPVLAAAITADVVPAAGLDALWWQPVLGGPFPLSFPDSGRDDPEAVLGVIDGPVRDLTDAVRSVVSVSPHVVWGNVASAINSAAGLVVAARPHLACRATPLLAALLDRPPLQGTALVTPAGFRRNSCCLIYRTAPGAAGPTCGDCVLTCRTQTP